MDRLELLQSQVATLLEKGYPKLAGMSEEAFSKLLSPLEDRLTEIDHVTIDAEKGKLPFVIVVKSALVPLERQMATVTREGKSGVVKLYPHEPNDFQTISTVSIPNAKVYLIIGIDRGKESINIPPFAAMQMIVSANRSPLTIEEGVAIMTQYPDFLMKNNCFSLLASRNPNDKRVPAIWINAQKQPNLGWCWEGNPHTWLGSASCKRRE